MTIEQLLKELYDDGQIKIDPDNHGGDFTPLAISLIAKFYAWNNNDVFDDMLTQNSMEPCRVSGNYFDSFKDRVSNILIESVQGGSEWDDLIFHALGNGE